MITERRCSIYENYIEEEPFCNCTADLFGDKLYFQLKLINDNMNITAEIDDINRFTFFQNGTKGRTRIKFYDIDYFILPLIMFKNFHIQFDAEKIL